MPHSAQRLWLLLALPAMLAVLVGAQCAPTDGTTPPDTTTPGNSGVTGRYIGSERCQLCHSNVHTTWTATNHSTALETLEAIGQDGNAACLPCHTVGFGEVDGFVSRATTDDLAGVGCEACHGPARQHTMNASDRSFDPVVNISAELCAGCHAGAHHPNADEFSLAGHNMVVESVGEEISAGDAGRLTGCGQCHSGDFFYNVTIQGGTMTDTALQGVPVEELNAVECAICHDPHARTGNASAADAGRDFQLRYPEVATPTPTNTVAATTDKTRFNLCGQCHHDRGTTYTGNSRPPHHSVQANVYTGEMPMPVGEAGLVLSRVSVHSFAPKQCATCHMYRQDFASDDVPAIAGHTFEVNLNSCVATGCHPSMAQAQAAKSTVQGEMQSRMDAIVATLNAKLGGVASWEFASEGGPGQGLSTAQLNAAQAAVPVAAKKARFLYHYSLNDGSLGIHNPDYVREMLVQAQSLADSLP